MIKVGERNFKLFCFTIGNEKTRFSSSTCQVNYA